MSARGVGTKLVYVSHALRTYTLTDGTTQSATLGKAAAFDKLKLPELLDRLAGEDPNEDNRDVRASDDADQNPGRPVGEGLFAAGEEALDLEKDADFRWEDAQAVSDLDDVYEPHGIPGCEHGFLLQMPTEAVSCASNEQHHHDRCTDRRQHLQTCE
jgi:hypothetical protein